VLARQHAVDRIQIHADDEQGGDHAKNRPVNLLGLIVKGRQRNVTTKGRQQTKHKPCQIIQHKKAEPKSRHRRSR